MSFLDAPAYTVLQAPVPAFEGFVRGRLERWAPDFLRTDGGVHAHVTVLAPFLPEAALTPHVLATLRATCAAASSFEVRFERVARFATGLAYAVPEPDGPFRALTDAVLARFGGLRPYDGEFEAAPHLSLDHGDPDALAAELTWPRTARVDAVELVRYQAGATRALHRYPLGTAPAAVGPRG